MKKISQSGSGKVVFTNMDILFSNSAVDSELRGIPLVKRFMINKSPDKVDLKSFIVEVLDLVCILGPISSDDLIDAYKRVKSFHSFDFDIKTVNVKRRKIRFAYVLDLLVAANLLIVDQDLYAINSTRYHFANFMFDLTATQFNSFRAAFLSRKFRYKYSGASQCL